MSRRHINVLCRTREGNWRPLMPALVSCEGAIPAPNDTVVVKDSRWVVREREWDLAQGTVYLYVSK